MAVRAARLRRAVSGVRSVGRAAIAPVAPSVAIAPALAAGLSAANGWVVSAPSALVIVPALSAVSMAPAVLAAIGLALSAQVATAGVRIVPLASALVLIAPVLSAGEAIFARVLRGAAAAAVAPSAARGAPRARAALEHALPSRIAALCGVSAISQPLPAR